MAAMEHISRGLEWVAVGIILAGLLATVLNAIRRASAGETAHELYVAARRTFGRGVLLGLEVLVAADLIRTVAVEPTLTSVTVLGIIVIVRTILSFSLDIEIDGVLPWRKRQAGITDDGA
jgi:uncharacterized membrane protein